MKTLSLENDLLKVQFLPEFGGKIVSLCSTRTGLEFIHPSLNEYAHVSPSADFSAGDGGGFDECLPSIAACERIAGEPSIPDHGDLWRVPWHVDAKDGAIVLHAESTSRPLRLTRKATLEDATLVLEYDVVNFSDTPTSWLWSAHPLLQVHAGDRILLPDEIEKVAVEYSAGGLFEKGTSIPWPIARSPSGSSTDLSKVPAKDGVTAHKLFAHMGKSGWGALFRSEFGQGLVVRFDPNALPFMGLWICAGAWPSIGVAKQFTVALEPTTSDADSLDAAVRNGTSRTLNAQEHFRWRLNFQLLGASEPVDFESFSIAARL
jgi:galactose mutarotase-like enzyme